ncbi:MAG: hypothetical protein K0R82_786, partial [Flavipsychrobacter sp.]|nr:hypothetical protein [Flavipsychrobacter sp.]
KFNYQGIARNNSGAPLANQSLGIRLSVMNDSATGELRYRETHTVSTNGYGLFNLAVGGGTADSNTMDSVVWATGEKWMLVEIDAAGGTSYTPLGASQLLSVPYALHSENPGPPGVMTVKPFVGSIGTIAASGTGFVFAGPTTPVTVTAAVTRITGCANAALGLSAGGPITVQTNLCYQLGAGPVTTFNGSGYLVSEIGTERHNISAMATVVLPPGTYEVGFCIYNGSVTAINDNDFVSGWVILTP